MNIDKLTDIVNKCNNAHHRTIKMKPILSQEHILIFVSKVTLKILDSKLMIA